MNLPLEFCAAAMGARALSPAAPGVVVTSYGMDTRTLQPGALFFALQGETQDGHAHVAAAFERGALAAVVTHPVDCPGTQLVVNDTLLALQALARAARERWGEDRSRRVVAITGSAGKTTTKEAIAAVLSTSLRIGKTSGNFNNHIGVPLSILSVPDDAQVAVLEIGMSHPGEIRTLAAIAQPHVGVVTNVGTAHIESFDSIDGIARAKFELIEALPADGVAILNGDDERVRRFAETFSGRSILYGTQDNAEVRASGIAWHADGCEFTLEGSGRFRCPLPARGGLMTALAALATARAFGINLSDMKDAIAALQPPNMRLQRIECDGMVIWDDCYNSNPEAACMMLDLLAVTPAGRRIAVLGEMRELGTWAEELHREVGRHAVQCGVSVLVGIRGAARCLVDAAREAGLPAGAAYFFEEPRAAGQFLKTFARPGDSILFKGSRGTRVELALEEFLR